VYNINNNNYNNRNNIVNISRISDRENRNINIGDSSIITTNNVVNKSIGENGINISNFLNNEYGNIYIYVTWYRLYIISFLTGRDADIIDFKL